MGQDCLRDLASQFASPVQSLPHTKEHANGKSDVDDVQYPLITHICATNTSTKLRRIPIGFYVAVKTEHGTWRTLNKPASVGKDIVQWDDRIVLPSCSSRISFTVLASFELGQTLGDGEVVREVDVTMSELLDRSRGHEVIRLLGRDDGDIEVKIQQVTAQSGYAVASKLPVSDEVRRIEELTDMGYRALARHRGLPAQRDLDDSIRHFERARDLCPPSHPNCATVSFNLANAKMMNCRMNDVSPDLDEPIELYRTALCLRSRDDPDHPLTLLSLGVGLKARSQRQADGVDKAEGDTLLSQVLDISPLDSYIYHAAFFALNSAATPELLSRKWTPHSDEHGDNDDEEGAPEKEEEKVDRLDATLQWIFYPNSSRPVLLDPLGILFCVRLDWIRRLIDRERGISVLEVVAQSTADDHPNKPGWLVDLASSLQERYECFGAVADLEEALSVAEGVVLLTPDGHPDKPLRLGNLAVLLSSRNERFGDIADLERSILLAEDVVQLTPDSHPDKPRELHNLAALLTSRYERFGDVMDLGKSISLTEDAVGLIPDGHQQKPLLLGNLAHSLSIRYKRFGDFGDLEKSISLEEEAVQLTPDGFSEKPLLLGNLAVSLSIRYDCSGDITDLERSMLLAEDVVQLTPDGHPDKPERLDNLASSLSSRYQRFGDIADLGRSISLGEDAVQLTPDGHPDKPTRLGNLARSLSNRYDRFGDIADLKKSTLLDEEAVRLTPDGRSDKPLRLSNLAGSLLSHYDRSGDTADLERSILLEEDVIQLTPDGHPDKPRRLHILASSLSNRYERFGNVVDLEKSISLKEDIVRLVPDGHSDKPRWLSNLAHTLSSRYHRFGGIADLEKSISLEQDAIRLTPDGHSDKPLRLNNLAGSLLNRYNRFGDIADLEKSISLREDAVRLTPDGHSDKPLRLGNLASSLLSRYTRFGETTDLEKSISLEQDAVELTPDGHPDKPLRLDNLARSLSSRYNRFGDTADLERSISLAENVVQLTPDGRSDKPQRLENLASSLSDRYLRFGNVEDLEKSISSREDILELVADSHPKKPLCLGNLASSLSYRYSRLGDIEDLEQSMSLQEDTVRLTPDGHPDKPVQLSNLAYLLSSRYDRFGDIASLEKSMSLREDAMRLTPDGHPDKPVRLHDMAHSFLQCFRHSGELSTSDLHRAISYSSRAAESYTGRPSVRFRSSQLWIQCLRHLPQDTQSLFHAYTVTVELLPHLAWIGLSFQDRYHQLLRAAGVVCDAAAAALELHRPDIAAEWLEQGRSIVWSQFLQLRTPVDDLRSAHPALAAQFEHVSHSLERAGVRDSGLDLGFAQSSDVTDGPLEEQAHQYHELALEREKLLIEIRTLPGFERFLLPKQIDQLFCLGHSGPIVFLNASKHRCDALVVMGTSKQILHVPLSQTNYDEIVSMRRQLDRLLLNKGLRDETDPERGARLVRLEANDVFKTILSDLWNKVVGPILDVLGSSTPSAKPSRIFWCPTGPFTFLPIHAAGIYGADNRGPKLSEFAISSYIPTMSTLQKRPQQDSRTSPDNIHLLAVPQPSTDGQRHLYGVEEEMEVMKVLTSSSPFIDFQEADGTVDDVLAKMKESDWVHFCCHGTQDQTNPLDSGLLLADRKRLKISDIVQLSRPRGGLALLSACQTATGNERLLDEAIHLAAGMLLAGYSGVIATMWSIMDNDAPRVTKDVYMTLFGDGRVPDSRRAAEALHHAIGKLRDSGAPFWSWVPFVHYGL